MRKGFAVVVSLYFLFSSTPLFAQNLGYHKADYLEISSKAGPTNNNFMNKLWLYRMSDGSGWTSASLFDGISIDVSCLVPGVDALTWWQRDPGNEIQTWGSRNSTYMTLKGTKLGIGTDDPKTPLDIQSSQNGWIMSSRATATSLGDINGVKLYSGYPGEDKWAGIASVAENLHSNKTGLALFSGMTERLRISGDGNVGIGTIAPRAFFDVANYQGGGNLGSVFSRLPEGDGNGEGTYLGIKAYATQPAEYEGKTFSLVHSFYGRTNNSINFYRGTGVTGGFITFSTNDNIEQMRIDPWGKVGIGLKNPTEMLSVNGRIKAKEVRVDGTGAPDYVFEENYQNLTLPALESYIKANKHLPEVPSAKELERDGMAIGEMNKLLLKKIEELTLHLIEKDKQYKGLLGNVKKQDERIRLLEKRLRKL
ncbi:hypothetical protein [uncultured Pedobacter sp.]|uniref:hypothetical protein n=1 Tax=uncultured Pedobacter sp. TaxID=246139 RepID=UPI0025DFA3DC|nr:hypothetical protein [uncultured Pedobacter sp.]